MNGGGTGLYQQRQRKASDTSSISQFPQNNNHNGRQTESMALNSVFNNTIDENQSIQPDGDAYLQEAPDEIQDLLALEEQATFNYHDQERELEEFMSRYIEVAQLSNGQSFGDLALIEQKPRMASIRCL